MATAACLKVYSQINGPVKLCTGLKSSDASDQFWV